jgi:hypothetical protein
MPSPPVVLPAPVLLPSGDDIIVHEAVEQPVLFGDLPAAGGVITDSEGAARPATELDVRQLAVAALLPAEESSLAAEPTAGGPAADPAAQPPAAATTQELSPKTTHPTPAVSEGDEPGADGPLAFVMAPPAALSASSAALAVSSDAAAAPGAATLTDSPSAPSAPATTSDMPRRQAEAPAAPPQLASTPEPPAAQDAPNTAMADAVADEMDRLEVESSDGSYCSAASQSGGHQG